MVAEENSIDNSETLGGFNAVIQRFRGAFKFNKNAIDYDLILKPDEKVVFSGGKQKFFGIGGKDYALVVTDSNHNGGIDGDDKIVVAKGQDAFVSSVKDFIHLCKEASSADVTKDGKTDAKDLELILKDPEKVKGIMDALSGDFQLMKNITQAGRLISDFREGGNHVGQLASQLITQAQHTAEHKLAER